MTTSSGPIDQALAFGKLVPGFEFLQGLVKNAGAALPNIGSWVAPTLNPEELEKRIEELRTVQFWLEQNARMLGATIQALEVQRMTLSTLKSMNVPVDVLRDSLTLRTPSAPAGGGESPAASARKPAAARGKGKAASDAAGASLPVGAVDPMQWWGALTKQFTQLAATAMKDAATDSAKNLASNLVKQSFSAAEQTLKAGMAPAKKAAEVAGSVVGAAARTATRKAAPARKAAARPAAKSTKNTADGRGD
ncbi:PhaM family polyhydroxyalkanoate granule multifunctional regulatory protein [Methylibium rhizosphaerae]|uniref:PhaM family polyhydroxyalkanoate granule multifunctional regulatory protein n=1 Tax=Methylibium rhizosphaerae TaxID=2570323 RepID=UPI0011267D52|nr:PhaM family polyhydroxyalkanoate granule multifunctional regulatory protein [Methylibium rhizosphaerae]